MKKILWFCGYTGAAILFAFLAALVLGWSFLTCFFLEVIIVGIGYLALIVYQSLHQTHPRTTKWLLVIMAPILSLLAVAIWLWLGGTFPFTRHALDYAIDAREVQISRAMDKGLSGAQAAFLISLREQEEELAKQIRVLMATNGVDKATNAYALQKAVRAKIESVLEPVTPPTTASKEPPAKSQVVSYTINKDEVVSTLSVPDNSTVYMEADKSFGVFEGHKEPDGTINSSKQTFPAGRSTKYFTWGGTLRLIGLQTNTTVKLHL